MIQEKLIKKTTTLKTLDRIEGSEGYKDYFVIFEDRVRFCLKLDFHADYAGHPTGFFVRIRMIPAKKIDLYNMTSWFNSNFKTNEVAKKLNTKFIKGQSLTVGDERVSYVLVSHKALGDYGDPQTLEGYKSLMVALKKDFDDLGNRILRSIGIFSDTDAKLKKVIKDSMDDYITMYAPVAPKEKTKSKKASVTPIKKKVAKKKGIVSETVFQEAAEEILTDICGEPMTIEFADDTGDPKIKPKK